VAKKVLMMSHGITGVTGFANQLMLQSRALLEEGYEVMVLHRDYRGEPIIIPKDAGVRLNSGRSIDGLTILPAGNQQWGEDVLPFYIEKYKPDYVHTLGDIWCYQYIKNLPKHHQWKWLAHYVFDTENMVGFWNDSVRAADIAVVPSKIASEMLDSLGHKNVKYIPHGIDTNTFKPCTNEEKMQFREEISIPKDAFIIGMVAHNQYRKMVNRLIDAFEIFIQKNPNSFLLLHCVPRDVTGWDLPQLLRDKHLLSNVFFTDKAAKGVGDVHVPESQMRKLYCSMDVHAVPTGGEGFGVPIIESMACGIPTVATAYTTPKEFFCDPEKQEDGKMGLKPIRGFPVPYVDIDEHHTGGVWAKISVPHLASTIQYIKDNESEAQQRGMKARKFVVENYDNELIKTKWKELYGIFDEFVEFAEKHNKDSPLESIKAVRLTNG